jgi:hypothetical protein
MLDKLNDFFFARNEYSISPPGNDTVNTFSYDVMVQNGEFVKNGNYAPVLEMLRGST